MKNVLMTIIVFVSCHSNANITGISTKDSLLQQLNLVFSISVEDLALPSELVAKLPVKNDLEQISPSFINSWTQISFLACQKAIENGATLPKYNNLALDAFVFEWLSFLSKKAWGLEISKNDFLDIYGHTFKDKIKNDWSLFVSEQTFMKSSDENSKDKAELKNLLATSCMLILSNPKTYITYF